MNYDSLLEPLKGYHEKYKEEHLKNTVEYFDMLTKEAKVSPSANKTTVSKYKEALEGVDKLNKKISSKTALRGFLIFLIVASVIGFITVLYYGLFKKSLDVWLMVLLFIIFISLILFSFFYIRKKLNNEIKSLKQAREEQNKIAQNLLNEAWQQMAPLNALFDWGMSEELFTKTVGLIQMDKTFDTYKYEYLHDKYGFEYSKEDNVSTALCESGSILGNPFLVVTEYVQSFVRQRYEGSLTIHWTERVSDGNGGSKTVHRSQTLFAHIYQPKPVYEYETYLIYGNEAAPNLTFHRAPTDVENMKEKQIDRLVKKRSKTLDKMARKAVSSNQNYTRFGNDEFEAIFGGEDRDNEVEYRLLFTPLAQQNMLKLLKIKDPYGDDFYFAKEKQMNYIRSEHSQTIDYGASPTQYVSYDYEQIKKKFIDYNQNFFKGIYFDLAPLMSIPVYQQYKTKEFIYHKKLETNVSHYEHETIANTFDFEMFKPVSADTSLILKTHFDKKLGNADIVNVTAFSFTGEKRVTYVSVLGGDGRMHAVPVYWIEYIPVKRETKMAVEAKKSSRFEYNTVKNNETFQNTLSKLHNVVGTQYARGLFGALLAGDISKMDLDEINNVYQKESLVDEVLKNEKLMKAAQLLDAELNEEKNLGKINSEDFNLATAKLNDDSITSVEKEVDSLSFEEDENEDNEVSNDKED